MPMALEKEASAMHLIEKLAEYKVGAIALTKIEKLAAKNWHRRDKAPRTIC